jgi:hypothetical protein
MKIEGSEKGTESERKKKKEGVGVPIIKVCTK